MLISQEELATALTAGKVHHQQGRPAQAEQAYAEILRQDPDHAEALHLMGMLAIQGRQPQIAVELISRAIATEPNVAAMYSNRAVALSTLGRDPHAVEDYRRAIALQPGFGAVHVNLGAVLFRLGRHQDAMASFDAALVLYPADAALQARRAECLHALGRTEEALAGFEGALALNPGVAAAHLGLGAIRSGQGLDAQAAESYAAAIALEPANPLAHFNLGNALRLLQRLDEAITSYDQAIALNPDFAIAHHNRAFCLLQKGDLAAGFAEYEWRRRCPTFDDPRYRLPRPWAGEDLAGKSLFVFPELFQGDLIQFCRYALTAERRGARVRLAAPAAMHGLLQSLSPTRELLPEDAQPDDDDFQAPLMTLPGGFRTTLESLPGEAAYLRADLARTETWRARIGTKGFKIGVVWQGSTAPYALPLQRSYPLAALGGDRPHPRRATDQPAKTQWPGATDIPAARHDGGDVGRGF